MTTLSQRAVKVFVLQRIVHAHSRKEFYDFDHVTLAMYAYILFSLLDDYVTDDVILSVDGDV